MLPAQFWWPTQPDILVPLALDDHDRTLARGTLPRGGRPPQRGVSAAQAREEMRSSARGSRSEFPAENANHAPNLRPLRDALVGDVADRCCWCCSAPSASCCSSPAPTSRRSCWRARRRARRNWPSGRPSARAAAGWCSRCSTESLVHGGRPAAPSACCSRRGARRRFAGSLPAQFAELPGIDQLGLDARVLTAALGVSLVTGLVFGLAAGARGLGPAHRRRSTKASRGAAAAPAAGGCDPALVVAELALSLVLLVGAGLLMVELLEPAPRSRQDFVPTTWSRCA